MLARLSAIFQFFRSFIRKEWGLFLFACWRLFTPLAAQDLSRLNYFSTADGLPANQIINLSRDSEGFTWVLTRQGPARYDGRRFVPFPLRAPAGNLPQPVFSYMLIDGFDQMWVGTNKGLFRVSLATFTTTYYEKPLRPNCTDAGGNPWFTSASGLVTYDRQQDVFNEIPLKEGGKLAVIQRVCRGRGNVLIAQGPERFYRLDVQSRRLVPLKALTPDVAGAAFEFIPDENGLLWLSVWYRKTNGLIQYDPYTDRVLRNFGSATHPITSTDINGLWPDDDRVWLATNSGGLCWFSATDDQVHCYPADQKNPSGLWPQQLTSVFKDAYGNLWVGTLFGLYQAPANMQTTRLLEHIPFNANSLVSRPVTALEFVGEHLLAVGTMDGLSLYDRRRGAFMNLHLPRYNENPYNNQIRAFARAEEGSFWVASWSGLFRLDHRNGRILEYYITHSNAGVNHPAAVNKMWLGAIYRMLCDREGVLWVSGFSPKLARLAGRRFEDFGEQAVNKPLLKHRIECMLDLDERYLLFGTTDGMLRYDRQQRRLETAPVSFPGLPAPVSVTSLALSGNGDLLAVANGRPFRLVRRNGTFEAVRIPTPLDHTLCQQMIEDARGAVWITYEDGLIQPGAGENAGRVYDSRHYLLDNVFAVRPTVQPVKDPEGNLYFGGTKGVTVLNPEHFSAPQRTPPVIKITGLKVNGAVFDPDSSISRLHTLHLSWKQANLGFEFAVLNAAVPALSRFAYSLDGGMPQELDFQNTLNLSGLPTGSHLLRVTAANSDGVWDKEGVTLRIVIHPPWWRSNWAFAAYVGVLLFGAWRFYRFQLRQKLAQQETRQLREMDAFKSRFFTNITHEFRTPLTVILGMTERLSANAGHLTRDYAETGLEMIRRNGENLLRLINQILDLSKLENHALTLHYLQGDVLAYLRYISESLRSLAQSRDLTLQVESDQPAVVMDYDPERLRQIVHNLLSNAVKFTPPGGHIVLRLSVEHAHRPPVAVIGVSDTGVGIPENELPFLFDRFFQAGNQDRSKTGGTGIGLSLTRELVRAMGGDIQVESPVPGAGQGTLVSVRLPISNKAPAASGDELAAPGLPAAFVPDKDPQMLPGPPLAGDTDGQNRLLLVEDNPDVMAYIVACLQDEYRIECASNGREGIEKALETIPDLVLSDVMMPEKDGLEVCDALKNDERTSHIPIVLLTAKADVESRIAGLRRGADAYLSKPFHREELRLTLSNLLDRRRKWQEHFRHVGPANGAPAPPGIPQPDAEMEDLFLKKIRQHVEQHLGDADFDGPRLARAMLLSEVQLYRKIKALTGKSTAIYIRSIRLHKALELLRGTTLSVSEIAYDVGFDDPNYFSRTFSQEFGMAPSEMRK